MQGLIQRDMDANKKSECWCFQIIVSLVLGVCLFTLQKLCHAMFASRNLSEGLIKDSIVIDQRCGLQASSHCLCEQRVLKAKQLEERWLWLECLELGTEALNFPTAGRPVIDGGALELTEEQTVLKHHAPNSVRKRWWEGQAGGFTIDNLFPNICAHFFFEVMKTLFRLNDIYESLSFPSV